MAESTYAQARRAMISLKQKLAGDFAAAADNPVKDVSVQAVFRIGYYMHVSLARALKAEEKAFIPDRHMGVPVRYEVNKQATGPG